MTVTLKAHLTPEQQDGALMGRAQWNYPVGTTYVAEFWTASGLIIASFEAQDYESVWKLTAAWEDVFDIIVAPATTPEEGLRIGPGVLQSRPT